MVPANEVVAWIHPAKLCATGVHPATAVENGNDPGAPPDATVTFELPSAYVHPAPASVTVYVCPAIVSVPIRVVAFGFGAAVKFTSDVPALPDPEIVSQSVLLLVEPQVHALAAITPAAPAPPLDGTDPFNDRSVKLHVVPPCEIPIDCPAIVSVPDRPLIDPAFEAAVIPTDPFPVPDDGDTDAQGTPLDAVHEQFAPFAMIATLPAPPATP